MLGRPQTLDLGDPNLCGILCGAGEQDSRGFAQLRDLNSIMDD
jgi:hypothetical protein